MLLQLASLSYLLALLPFCFLILHASDTALPSHDNHGQTKMGRDLIPELPENVNSLFFLGCSLME